MTTETKSKEKKLKKTTEEDMDIESSEDSQSRSDKKEKKHPLLAVPEVQDSGRLFVRNLSYTCTEQDLRDMYVF